MKIFHNYEIEQFVSGHLCSIYGNIELREIGGMYPARTWLGMNVYYSEAHLLITKIRLYGFVHIVIKVDYRIYW